jgi:hypothetical protein
MKRFMASAAATSAANSGEPSARIDTDRKKKMDQAKADYIRNETSHSAFLHMLGKFEDTFDAQVSHTVPVTITVTVFTIRQYTAIDDVLLSLTFTTWDTFNTLNALNCS